uniref:Gypsy retrotransposon integrase-like protein 1 n=1 Tax=Nothobranchius furzeri TaxID=105023 RepID=A0A8C6KJR4_NOTFU
MFHSPKREGPTVDTGTLSDHLYLQNQPRLLLPATLLSSDDSFTLSALIDSGCEQNLIDTNFASQCKFKAVPLSSPIRVSALDGNPLPLITHKTEPVKLIISGNHVETLSFLLFPIKQSPIVLGFNWLQRHNPSLNWHNLRVDSWSSFCHSSCLQSALLPNSAPFSQTEGETSDLSHVPDIYHDLNQVFNKHKASCLPPHRPYDCAIDLLPGAPLPSSRLYNISRPEREAMETYIKESLSAGLIRPSSSPLGAGFFFVSKKDGSLRPCIDYRGLNQISVRNKYPLPLISSTFDLMQNATVFTKLDLRNAYLVRIRQGDEWKTAFQTPLGHYEYLVMPFGLTNAPAVFQAMINDVLCDFINRFVFVYLDDILIFSDTLAEHHKHVRMVLQRLLENRLYVKAEKSEFHRSSITFLGYIFEGGQVRTDPDKIKAVLNWPTPENRKQLQRFLGFANFYRRFIKNYSQTASPLTALTSTKSKFEWTLEASHAFTALKNLFASAPILIQPDPQKQFILEVDASDTGAGAVLSQRSVHDGKLHPCAFYSRRLSPAERNYDVGDRELLAIKIALEEWRHWLEGSTHPVLVWTDHKNLSYLQSAKRLNSRQSRWSLFFSWFNLTISFRPGSKNTKPDALSHQFSAEEGSEPPAPILPLSCSVGAVTWDIENIVSQALKDEPDPGTGPTNRTYVPSTVRSKLIHWFHTAKFSCHPGTSRTIALISRRFWWPSLHKDVRDYVLACPACACNKTGNKPPSGLLQPLPISQRPWSHIALDFVTGLPPSKGMTTILTVIDRFSKACHLIPLRKLPTAFQTAQLLVKHVFRLHGIPQDVLSDRGPQFISQVWKQFCSALGSQVSLSSGYHPQTNGQTERMNQELEASLRCVTSSNPSDWSLFLPWVEYAHNSHVSSATGLSPFEVSLGYQPPLFPADEKDISVTSVHHHVRRCRRVWSVATSALNRTLEQNRKYADRRRAPAPVYVPGQKVWLSSLHVPLKSVSRKLSPRFLGPYEVLEVLSPVSVRLRLPPGLRVHPTFHVSQIKPVLSSPLCPPAAPPPPALLVDGHPAWLVRRIVDSRRRGRGLQYLVDWEGYGPEARSWVPRSFILHPGLISDFEASLPARGSGPPGGVR